MSETRPRRLLRIATQDVIERHITRWHDTALATAAAGLSSGAPEHAVLRELRWLHLAAADVIATAIARELTDSGLIAGGEETDR